MADYGVIVVGAGFWGKEWIKTIQGTAGVFLSGVVARNTATRDELTEQMGLPSDILFEDYQEAVNQRQADIVAVGVPPRLHLPVIKAGLEAGKHVICEKPLADTWDAGLEIAGLVKSCPDQKFMVSQTRRYVPHIETIRKFIADGKLGKVSYINFDHSVYDPDNYGWRLNLSSVVLEDMSSHHFDVFRYITGQDAVSVYAEGWLPSWSQYPGKVCHNVLIEMTGDVHINYFATWTARG